MNNYNFCYWCCSCTCSSSSCPYWDSNLWLYTLLLNGCRSQHKFSIIKLFSEATVSLFTFLPFYLFAFSLFLLFPFMTFLLSFLLLILLPASFYIFHSSLPVFLVELISFQLIVSVSL